MVFVLVLGHLQVVVKAEVSELISCQYELEGRGMVVKSPPLSSAHHSHLFSSLDLTLFLVPSIRELDLCGLEGSTKLKAQGLLLWE